MLFPPTEDVLGEMPPTEAIQELGLPVVSGDLPAELTSGIAAGIASGAGGSGSEDGRGVTAAKLVAEKPFILSEGLPPVPSRLVARILRGEFVDMAEHSVLCMIRERHVILKAALHSRLAV